MKHFLALSLLLLLTGCAGERQFPEVKNLSEYKQTDFVTTPQSALPKGKNAVYSATMLLAWDQVRAMSENQLTIDGGQPELTLFNNSQSYKSTLRKGEYNATAQFNIEQGKLDVYAEFSKSLPLSVKLKDHGKELKFKGEAVLTFGANSSEYYELELYKSINILYYKNDSDFAIRLIPKDTEHEILLYMPNRKSANLQQMFDDLTQKTESAVKEKQSGEVIWKYSIDMDGDELLIPKFSFNIETNYKSLEGNGFKLKEQQYFIEKATQRTAFILDEAGAEVESEASMEFTTEEMPEPVEKPHPQKFHFNKPFLVMLKRVDSPNPYFAMWVDNTELMQKE